MYKKYSILFVCALLSLSTLIVYWPVKDHGFTALDDYVYVVDNPTVKNGLTYDGVICTFTSCAITDQIGHWHPLTWLSLMLDYELYGLKPGGYHITNLLFHIANTTLLFLILNLMTHALWRSAFVAMLFALHPLHVESVAWVTERKDVLSAFFGILTIGAYVFYSKRPGIARYAVVFSLFAFGLMSKSMLVTWPFVLLLLDYWPLKRFQQGRLPQKSLTAHPNPSPGKQRKKINRNPITTEVMPVHETAAPYEWPVIRRRIVEKIPLAVLSLLCSVITYDTTLKAGVLGTEISLIFFRIENALVSYTVYIRKMFWPDDLCIIYPYPDALSMWQIFGSVLVLSFLTGLALRFARRFPYLPVGWFWYIGTLIPVIGLIQAGPQAMADRYTYLPLVGLFIVIAWGITDLTRKWRHQRPFLVISSGVLLLALVAVTWSQLHLWSDDILLYEYSLNKTKENALIHRALGEAWHRKGDLDKAILHERQVVQLNPTNADAHYNLGISLSEQGKITEAIYSFKEAMRLKPNHFLAHDHLGKLLVFQGRNEEAMIHFQRAIKIAPKFLDAYINLGDTLASQGKLGEAADIYSRAIAVNPESAYAHYNLGTILASQEKIDEAIIHFREAARISPRYAKAHNNLGSMLLMKGNTEEAIDHFKRAIEIEPGYEMARMNLEDALRILNISGSYSSNPASKK